eukprot:3160736-Amphidinium_carterae.1
MKAHRKCHSQVCCLAAMNFQCCACAGTCATNRSGSAHRGVACCMNMNEQFCIRRTVLRRLGC